MHRLVVDNNGADNNDNDDNDDDVDSDDVASGGGRNDDEKHMYSLYSSNRLP